MKKRPVTFLLILIQMLLSSSGTQAAGIEFVRGTTLSFATVSEGAKLLTQRDEFIAALSPFERAARMVTNRPVSETEFRAFVETNVLAWTPEEIERLTAVFKSVGTKLAPWNLPFPQTILMVKTTGREEIEADYTRQNGIMLPENLVSGASASVVLHELFHVLSRHNPPLREKLYHLIGFQRINEVDIPAELLERRWTNPDGVQNGWRIVITNQNQEISVSPGLYAPAAFDYTRQANPFSYFRLLSITNSVSGKWAPRRVGGQPQLFQVHEVQGFNEQIGRNTRYVIHPDEIMADNFVLFINGRTNLPTPRIIEGMKEIFAR